MFWNFYVRLVLTWALRYEVSTSACWHFERLSAKDNKNKFYFVSACRMEQVERLLSTCQLNKIIYRFLVFLSWRYVSSHTLGAVCFVLEPRRLTFVSEPLSIRFEVYDPLPVVTWLTDNRKYVFPESEERRRDYVGLNQFRKVLWMFKS